MCARCVGLVPFPGKPSRHRTAPGRSVVPLRPPLSAAIAAAARRRERRHTPTGLASLQILPLPAPRRGRWSRAEIDRWATQAAGSRTSPTPRWTRAGAATCGVRRPRATSEARGVEDLPRREAHRGRTPHACSCPRSVRSIDHVNHPPSSVSRPLDSIGSLLHDRVRGLIALGILTPK